MSGLLLVATTLLPLLLVPLSLGGRARWWLPLAAVPALGAATLLPVGSALQIPWLLLGVHLQLDETARLFMLFSALVWIAAAWHVAARVDAVRRDGFPAWFLAAMAGNFLLLLAADMVTFYVGFTVMGLSVYGLIRPAGGQRVRRAARIYLAFTLCGEVALFGAMVLLVAGSGSILFADLAGHQPSHAALALLLIGFGIKVALPGLHPWLPLAYTLAPAAAVAVLSGPMMKAGLVGWLRFVPAGMPGTMGLGDALQLLGALGVLLGVVAGLLQSTPRAVLAYSSIAKMGLITSLFGLVLVQGDTGAALLAALLLFAVHHLLVKSALFLGIAEWERGEARRGLLVGSSVLALTLAAAPFTAGAAAKQLLGEALGDAFSLLLAFSAVGTALLMIRFVLLLAQDHGRPAGVHAGRVPWPWLALLPVAVVGPFSPAALAFAPGSLLPLFAAVALALVGWRIGRRWPDLAPRLRPGDLYWPLHRCSMAMRRGMAARLRGLVMPGVAIGWRPSPAGEGAPTLLAGGLRWLSVFLLLLLTVLLPP